MGGLEMGRANRLVHSHRLGDMARGIDKPADRGPGIELLPASALRRATRLALACGLVGLFGQLLVVPALAATPSAGSDNSEAAAKPSMAELLSSRPLGTTPFVAGPTVSEPVGSGLGSAVSRGRSETETHPHLARAEASIDKSSATVPASGATATGGVRMAQATGEAARKKPSRTKSKNSSTTDETAESKAEKALLQGIKAAEAGRNQQAAQLLTAALAGGKLAKPSMARALYHRGIVHRRLGKPAEAIADLTSATWLQGGLSAAERADALAQREGAYREAGVAAAAGDSVSLAAQGAGRPLNRPSPSTNPRQNSPTQSGSAAISQSGAAAAPGGNGDILGGLFSGLGSFFGAGTAGSGAAGSSTASVRSAPSPAPGSATQSAVSAWSSETTGKMRRQTTPRTGRPDTAGTPGSDGATDPASWTVAARTGTTTKAASASATGAIVARAEKASPPRKSTLARADANSTPPGYSARGKYRLRVAAVRSEVEARQLADRLRREHAMLVQGRSVVVETAVLGNMGTFYQVHIGPYADAKEPAGACTRIRAGGFDCMVVAR
jgi:hypothetical protein